MRAHLNALRRRATFSGRLSDHEFGWAHAVLVPPMLIAFGGLGAPPSGRWVWPSLTAALIVMPHLLPWATPVVWRGDDTGRTSWWALLGLVLLIVVPPLGLIALLGGGALRGRPGPNRHGPDGLGPAPSPPADGATLPPGAAMAGGTAARDPSAVIAELERLSRLRADGTLTAAEFDAMKAKALGPGRTT